MTINIVTLEVFLGLFAMVACIGLFGARWRSGDLSQLHEWGLGGQRFGTVVAWFLLGGDLYTAYTFIAVPALMFGAGATGFFAVPYVTLMFPLLFMAFPRLWSVARAHGYLTAADFVRGRFGHRGLSLAIAVTGMLAVLPYIALQLMGMQVVIAALGIQADWPVPGFGTLHSVPLIAAFSSAGGLYLYQWPARHGADRGRQGPAGVHNRAGRHHHYPGKARRL
jgi:SSS family solute:Na+ symporter